MKPQRFKEANKSLARPATLSEKQCSSLDVMCDGEQCVSLWRPSLRERLSILIFGRVWLQVLSGKTQPPVALAGARTIFAEPTP